jgi:hypothetical protein
MKTITARSADEALQSGVLYLAAEGVRAPSRAGDVLRAESPVVTSYLHPWRRVVFDPMRDANAVFHLMEALWMIAGRNDVAPLLEYNSSFSQFAEDDGRQHGAYGYRWRRHFGFDQIESAILQLQDNPSSRQVVLQMWDAQSDMGVIKRDRPCNTTVYFDALRDKLNMTVCCRSNDMVLGAYGANVVHMSILHELVALAIGMNVGVYHQFSNNFHAYVNHPVTAKLLKQRLLHTDDKYETGAVGHCPILCAGENWQDFINDCEDLFAVSGPRAFRTRFVSWAYELSMAYRERKAKLGGWKKRLEPLTRWDFAEAFKLWAARRDNGGE